MVAGKCGDTSELGKEAGKGVLAAASSAVSGETAAGDNKDAPDGNVISGLAGWWIADPAAFACMAFSGMPC
jgi:hypothetical protein